MGREPLASRGCGVADSLPPPVKVVVSEECRNFVGKKTLGTYGLAGRCRNCVGKLSGSCRELKCGFGCAVCVPVVSLTPVVKSYEGICRHPECDVKFTVSGRGAHLRRYCDEHYVGNTNVITANKPDAGLPGHCARCGDVMPLSRQRNPLAKYCSDQCRIRKEGERLRERERYQADMAGIVDPSQASMGYQRRGPIYDELDGKPELLEELLAGRISQAAGAKMLRVTEAGLSRTLATFRFERKVAESAVNWEPSPLTRAMLPTDKLLLIRELGLAGLEDTDEFQRLADELVRAYSVFSRFFFRLEGNRPIIKEFHLAWIRSIIVAYAVGGKQLILSPPRHGKSEVMIRFAVWFIVMFPNIRIVWVAANGDVAKIMLGAVKDHLMNNEELIAATLPKGDSYRPDTRSGRPWSSKEIKVRQQTHVGAKSSSMLALGASSKILSRDMDLLIVDDLEDFDSTAELSQRKKTKAKFAEYGTRKEENTAWIDIGSRQHPDDVAGTLIKSQGVEQGWRILVETAHSDDCDLDPEIIEGHDTNGCVLFPEVRTYRWLMEKKTEMDVLGIPGAYEMRYLNKPAPTSGIVFNVDRIREVGLDRSRDLGVDSLVAGRLVAGLDPSSRGTQAAFCWHFTPTSLSMVDLETSEAGGFAGAIRVMEEWADSYNVRDWYYEDNSQQVEFFRDPRVLALKAKFGLTIEPHTTGKNKQDPELGISSMAPWYHNGTITLPYGTSEARRKVNLLLSQLELWTTDGITFGRNRKTDIKMASWFPFPRIVRWSRVEKYQDSVERGHEQSYPGISRSSAVPWATPYPKGTP